MNVLIAMGIGKAIGLLSIWMADLFQKEPPYVQPEVSARFYDREFINSLKLVV